MTGATPPAVAITLDIAVAVPGDSTDVAGLWGGAAIAVTTVVTPLESPESDGTVPTATSVT